MSYLEEPQESQLEEIDLLDFMRIIKRRKKIILGLFLIGLLSGIIWYFLAPSSYEGTMILKIGEFENIKEYEGTSYEGTIILKIGGFENVNEIVEKLRRGVYDDYPKLEVINPSNTDLIEINLAAKSHNETKEFLEKIKTDILSIHNQKADDRKQAIDQEISFLENKIEDLKKDVSYFMARGEQVALFKLEIYNTEKLISDLEKEKTNISMSEVINGPDVIEKRPGYLAVFFAGMLGLFIGLILAFFIDWLEKNKKRI
jgi:LPS O-antigen subunit length determinant protein (WzzB/FepE family)